MNEAEVGMDRKKGTGGSKRRHPFVSVFFVLFVAVAAYMAGAYQWSGGSATGENQAFSLPTSSIFSSEKNAGRPDMGTFWKAWDILHNRFVDRGKLETTALLYGAVRGMLAATDDPYTTFFDPEENKSFQEDISGSFEGIGAEIGIKNKILTIVAPLDDTPAARSGLRSGDKVLKINDESTAEMNIDEARNRMRGKKGTEVKLTIFREGDRETRDIVIRRDTINVKSVKLSWKDDSVAIVKVNQFGEDTTNEFLNAVREIRSKKALGMVIDLRDNPGGLLDSAVDIASIFLPKGKTVVFEEDGQGKRETLSTHGGDIVLNGIPVVLLINEGSASASEILAAALRENREDIVLVGKKSFGKGSVQELVPVSRDTSLKVTVARWLTPLGKQINKEGIAPDVEIELSNEDYDANRDPQMDKSLEILWEKIRS